MQLKKVCAQYCSGDQVFQYNKVRLTVAFGACPTTGRFSPAAVTSSISCFGCVRATPVAFQATSCLMRDKRTIPSFTAATEITSEGLNACLGACFPEQAPRWSFPGDRIFQCVQSTRAIETGNADVSSSRGWSRIDSASPLDSQSSLAPFRFFDSSTILTVLMQLVVDPPTTIRDVRAEALHQALRFSCHA